MVLAFFLVLGCRFFFLILAWMHTRNKYAVAVDQFAAQPPLKSSQRHGENRTVEIDRANRKSRLLKNSPPPDRQTENRSELDKAYFHVSVYTLTNFFHHIRASHVVEPGQSGENATNGRAQQ